MEIFLWVVIGVPSTIIALSFIYDLKKRFANKQNGFGDYQKIRPEEP